MKRSCLVACWCWLALVGSGLSDEAPRQPELPRALRFRRIYAPADRITEWPLKSERYLPIDSVEFDRLVEAARQSESAPAAAEGAQLVAAEYHARLEGDDVVLQGDATLTVAGPANQHNLLLLEPMGLAVARAAWDGATPDMAALGRDADGQVGVLVEQPGRLKLAWSLRGERGPQGELAFAFALPRCATNRLVVDLPESLIPSVDRGMVETGPAAKPGRKAWRVELGGTHRCVVRLADAGAAAQQPPALLRQNVAYEFSPRGVDVTAQLNIDVQGKPLRQLTVELDPRLRLVTAHSADKDVPWTTSESPLGGTRVVLDLPEPISGTGRTVRLSALATVDEQRSWRLPQIIVEGMAWLEGTLVLVVPKPLVLDRIDTVDCRQLKAAPLAAPLSGESLEFQCFRPAANVDVVLTRPTESLHIDTGSIVEMGAAGISCRAIAEISLRQDEQFKISADLEPNWIIDAVEATNDPTVIADWQVDSELGVSQLNVTLKHSVSARQPLRLRINGHRSAGSSKGLELRELEMLHFVHANFGRRWMAVSAADTHELRLEGAGELTRIDPQQLTATESRLFPEPPSGLVFAVDAAADRLKIATVPRKPTYVGEINIDVVADGKMLTERYTLRCSSPSARVERVLLFCSHARPTPLRFSLAGASGGQITARQLAPDDPAAGRIAKTGEAWELVLRLPRSGPFEIRAERSFPFTGPLPLSLAALPEAASQRGTLTIRALGETGIGIENHRLRPIPAELAESELYPTTRGAFRYEPHDASSADPAISIHPISSPASESGAWVWRSQLDSRYALRDVTVHMATWHVQTAGRSRLNFSLPAGAELRGVTVDDLPLPDALVSGFGTKFPVDLPAGKQFATVVVSFAAAGGLPRLAGSLHPAWPEVDIPVLARRWQIWLPPGYELAASDERWETTSMIPLSWSQRLFGPLGRSAWQTAFHPLRLGDWSNLLNSRQEAARGNLDRFTKALGDIVAMHADDPQPMRWGRLCDLLASAPAVNGIDVLVDTQSLDQIGLRADSVAPNGGSGSGIGRGLDVIDRAELIVLYNDRFVVVTTSAAVAGQSDGVALDDGRATAWIMPGPMADEIDSSGAASSGIRYVPLAIWSRLSGGPPVPWRHESARTTGWWATRGWSTSMLSIADQSDRPVSILRPAAMQSCAWALFLLFLSIGVWQRRARRLWLLAAVMVLAAITLVVTSPFAVLSAAAFLGAFGALVWATVDERRPRPVAERPSRHSVPNLAAPALWLLSLTLALSAAVRCWADEPIVPSAARGPVDVRSADSTPSLGTSTNDATSAPSKRSTGDLAGEVVRPEPANPPAQIYRVFVPIDADREPDGSKVYVPEELFQGLSRRAARTNRQPGDWLMTRASYHLQLSRENAEEAVAVVACKAVFDLHVFRAGAELNIPLGAEGTRIVRGSVKLDGRVIDVAASALADHLSLVADQTGMVRLEVGLAPEVQSDGTTAGFDLSVPPVPISTLAVSFAGEPVAVEVPGASGQLAALSSAGTVVAELGPSGHLAVRWPEDKRAASAHPNVDVDELLWVTLQAGSPVIDARFKCRAAGTRVRHLRLLVDPRLQLLPSAGERTSVTAIHATPATTAGDPVTLDLELADEGKQPDHEVIVDLAFLVTGTSGIGNFRLPRLEAQGVHSSRRLLAVTLDPSLHYEEQLGDDVKPQNAADFLAAWGAASREPQLVYSVPQGIAAWILATRPAEVRNSVEQLTVCSFGQGVASVHCSAALTTSAGHNFQLRLIGPPRFEIQNVSLVEGGVQRVARWSADDSGAITVFLTGPVSGRQQFSLEGRLRAPAKGEVTLPGFRWLDAEVKKNQIEVFRQATTLVEMGKTTGVTPVEPAAEERLKSEWGRLVASYLQEDPQTKVSVHLAPNQPQTSGRQILVVDRDHDSWTGTIDLEMHVRQGLVDMLRFDVPPQWTEPYKFDHDVQWELLPIPTENRRQLVIRPAAPIDGDYSLRVRGQLVPAMGDRLGVADINLRGLGQLDRFVVLPQKWEREQVDWETPGLVATRLPTDLLKRLALRSDMRTFHVLGEHYQASLKNIEHKPSRPRVSLADIHYAWQADGDYYGVGVFDLSPASASTAVIKTPPGMSIVSVAVADSPAAVTAGPHGAQFGLGPPQLPQHVEIVFQGTLPSARHSAAPHRFEAPSLDGLEVDETLWTIYGPAEAGRGETIGGETMTAAAQELERLEATKSILALAAHVASEQTPEEMIRWKAPWKGRFLAARARVGRLALASNPPESRQDLDGWARQENDVASRLDVTGTSPAVLGAPAFEPVQLLAANVAMDPSVTAVKFLGNASSLAVYYPRQSHGDFGWRVACAIMLLGLAAMLAWKRPAGIAVQLTIPQMLALLGVCWWLWLAPSVVGFVLLTGTLAVVLAGRIRPAGRTGPTTLPTG